MKETHKTVLLWAIAGVVLLLSLTAAALSVPPPFSSYVQPREDIVSSWDEVKTQRENSRKLDANTATLEQLIELPGMTQRMAENIVYLRKSLVGGRFSDLSEWLRAEGVTPELLETWKTQVFCG